MRSKIKGTKLRLDLCRAIDVVSNPTLASSWTYRTLRHYACKRLHILVSHRQSSSSALSAQQALACLHNIKRVRTFAGSLKLLSGMASTTQPLRSLVVSPSEGHDHTATVIIAHVSRFSAAGVVGDVIIVITGSWGHWPRLGSGGKYVEEGPRTRTCQMDPAACVRLRRSACKVVPTEQALKAYYPDNR